jgi:rubrerythrin
MEAFIKIGNYYKSKVEVENDKTLEDIATMLASDITTLYPEANKAAKSDSHEDSIHGSSLQRSADRGALRSLVWSEKVSSMTKLLLQRYAKEGDEILENTKIYVCDICGFIFIGDTLPQICPICKVPNYKMHEVERR